MEHLEVERFPGCLGMHDAIELGYLRVLPCSTEEGMVLTVVTFSEMLESLEDAPVMCLNYCPFCGAAFEKGFPTCAGAKGERREEIREVDL